MVAHCSYVRSDNLLQACSLEEKSSVPSFTSKFHAQSLDVLNKMSSLIPLIQIFFLYISCLKKAKSYWVETCTDDVIRISSLVFLCFSHAVSLFLVGKSSWPVWTRMISLFFTDLQNDPRRGFFSVFWFFEIRTLNRFSSVLVQRSQCLAFINL